MRLNKLGTAVVVLLATLCIVGAATAKTAKTGGTLNVDLTTDLDYTDPALGYLSTGWELEYATCLKLMNYPDGMGPKTTQLVPEAAAGFPKVSNNGKTYDFTVSAGFTTFSDGSKVTAASFKAAFDRDADPKMQSTGTWSSTSRTGEPRRCGRRSSSTTSRRSGSRSTRSSTHTLSSSRTKARAASRSTSPTSREVRTTPTRTTSSTFSWTAATSRTRTTTTSRISTIRRPTGR